MAGRIEEKTIERKFKFTLNLRNGQQAHMPNLEYINSLSLSENFMRANFYVHNWLDTHDGLCQQVTSVQTIYHEDLVQ